jgi:transcriptional regulator with XRE-family HTH domain
MKFKHLPSFLLQERSRLNLTQGEFGKLIGVTDDSRKFQMVSNWERKLAQLPVKHLAKCSQALDVSVLLLVDLMLQDQKEIILKKIGITDENSNNQ